MELKRDIYKRLLEWKQDDSGKVIQVSGARQLFKQVAGEEILSSCRGYRRFDDGNSDICRVHGSL